MIKMLEISQLGFKLLFAKVWPALLLTLTHIWGFGLSQLRSQGYLQNIPPFPSVLELCSTQLQIQASFFFSFVSQYVWLTCRESAENLHDGKEGREGREERKRGERKERVKSSFAQIPLKFEM
uniref:Uncharacterized protein n=1 Tax=Micrurus paraensis TaxID=1970185 RepID=A0A2D4KJ05_9SAUR